MARARLFTQTEKNIARAHANNGMGVREIARAICRSPNAVSNFLSRGDKPPPRLGRPRVFNQRTRAAFSNHVQRQQRRSDGRLGLGFFPAWGF